MEYKTISCHLLKLAFCCCILLADHACGAPDDTAANNAVAGDIQFGVFPFLSASRLEKIFAGVAQEMGTVLGRRVQYKSAADFNTFMTKLRRQTYDIAYIQPFDFVRITEGNGYVPLVKRNGYLEAVVLVGEGSELKDIAGLRGRSLGLPPQVAAVSYLTMHALFKAGLMPGRDVNIIHYRNHDSCLHHLIIGEIDACGTATTPARYMEKFMHTSFRVIGRSVKISHSLIVVHERLPLPLREKLRDYLLSITILPMEEKILKNGKTFIPLMEGDYNDVREYWREFMSGNVSDCGKACILQ